MCTCVRVYVCTCVRVFVCTCVRVYVCMRVRLYLCTLYMYSLHTTQRTNTVPPPAPYDAGNHARRVGVGERWMRNLRGEASGVRVKQGGHQTWATTSVLLQVRTVVRTWV
jgi:hypothetical protein